MCGVGFMDMAFVRNKKTFFDLGYKLPELVNLQSVCLSVCMSAPLSPFSSHLEGLGIESILFDPCGIFGRDTSHLTLL